MALVDRDRDQARQDEQERAEYERRDKGARCPDAPEHKDIGAGRNSGNNQINKECNSRHGLLPCDRQRRTYAGTYDSRLSQIRAVAPAGTTLSTMEPPSN